MVETLRKHLLVSNNAADEYKRNDLRPHPIKFAARSWAFGCATVTGGETSGFESDVGLRKTIVDEGMSSCVH